MGGDLGDFSIKVSLSWKFMAQEDIGLYFNNCIHFMKKILPFNFKDEPWEFQKVTCSELICASSRTKNWQSDF